MAIVGLTGGIASGKSTVADLFQRRGVPVIDADRVAREVTLPHSEGLEAIIDAFGREVLTEDGELDRRGLRQRIFDQPELRTKLEAILHPRIRRAMLAAAARLVTPPYVLFVIPLLFETGQRDMVDRVLVIDCLEQLQIERSMQRDGIGEAEARSILAAQASREQRLAIADDLIVNTGDLARLEQQVDRLHRDYLPWANSLK